MARSWHSQRQSVTPVAGSGRIHFLVDVPGGPFGVASYRICGLSGYSDATGAEKEGYRLSLLCSHDHEVDCFDELPDKLFARGRVAFSNGPSRAGV